MVDEILISLIRTDIRTYMGCPIEKIDDALGKIFRDNTNDPDVGQYAERFIEYKEVLERHKVVAEELSEARKNLWALL